MLSPKLAYAVPEIGEIGLPSCHYSLVSPSLKESFVSRATWRILARTSKSKALGGFVNAVLELLLRNRIVDSVFTVFLFEVVEPFFSLRLHPYTSLRESFRRNRRKVRSERT
jgi:hypothetical protein